jgi:ABC-type dipeptide/oligopeptide/nickel transport system permease subunit
MSTVKTKKPRMLFSAFLRKYGRILIGGTILAVVFFCVIFADQLDMGYPHDSFTFDATLQNGSIKPGGVDTFGGKHLMGTDQLGRDIWSRILHGGRPTLLVALGAQSMLIVMGTVVGLLCGYYNKVERVVMRILEAFATIPNMLLTMLVMSLFTFNSEKSMIENCLPMMLSMSIHGVPGLARMIRNQVLSLREKEYIESEKAMGAGDLRTMFIHILPACSSYLLVRFSNGLSGMVLSMASLSFLGLGLPLSIPTWGFMVSDTKEVIYSPDHFYIFMWPTLVISITVFGFAMLGDGLRDLLDPRLK